MTANHEHTPTRIGLIAAWRKYNGLTLTQARDEVDVALAAAEQRGAARALREAAESSLLIDYMYGYFADDSVKSPAAVRATATYLHTRADRIANKEGDE